MRESKQYKKISKLSKRKDRNKQFNELNNKYGLTEYSLHNFVKPIRDRVKYCRIVRKMIRGKYKYYVQLVMEGLPPIKTDKETGEIKRSIGLGNVGIDIGTRTIAISSKYDVKLLELCPEVENIEKR